MGDFDGGGDEAGYNRPRRPNAETIAYLRGLSLDIQHSRHEIQEFLENSNNNNSNGDDDFPQTFAAAVSAIDEVQMEIASLAGDEHGSQCIEVLAHIAAPYSELAARVLLHSCAGYHLHLATHRYGSHVVQSILQLAVSHNSLSNKDLALHDDSPEISNSESLPSLSDLIQGIVEELTPHAPQLAIHVCGSHVLRTLLCVLGGVNLVASKGGAGAATADPVMETGAILRGRKKNKKKKRKKPDEDSSLSPHAGTMKIVYRQNSRLGSDGSLFSESLESIALALLGTPADEPGELQQLSCHSSAGPLFIVLLKVLTYSTEAARNAFGGGGKEENVNAVIADFRLGISAPEPKFETDSLAHTVVKRLLCIQDEGGDDQQQKHAGDIIFGLSGEPRGSHLLETMLLLSPDAIHADIIKYGDFASAESMQAYIEHEVSNFVVQTLLTSVRSKEQAETILKVVEKVISNGLAVDPSKKRRGILWRATELSAKYRVSQESMLKSIRLGFASLNSSNSAENTNSDEKKEKKQRKKASAVDMRDCVLRLINLRISEDSERIGLDAAGVRCVHHLLRFTPRLCEEILKTILEAYSAEELVRIAKDGLGSRCVMDGILDGAVKTPVFITAVKSLFNKLKGHWVSLATDRVGHHTVKKMFHALPKIDDKAKLADELSTGGNRLSGNAMGRSVVELVLLDLFHDNRKTWRQKMSKSMSKDDDGGGFMSEVTAKTGGGDDSELKTKSKRKRKRKRADKSGGDSEEKGPKKAQNSSSFGVDSILDAISMPKNE